MNIPIHDINEGIKLKNSNVNSYSIYLIIHEKLYDNVMELRPHTVLRKMIKVLNYKPKTQREKYHFLIPKF